MKKLRTVPAHKATADGRCSMCEQPVLSDPSFQYCDDECRLAALRYYLCNDNNHNNDWVPSGILDKT
jgi:hypothetical protein